MKKVVLFLVLYNDKHHIYNLIKSLKNQTFNNFDIFAVDCSEIKEPSKILKKFFPKSEIFLVSENLGYGKGNNFLLQKALKYNFDYGVVLNTDVILDKDFLKETIEILEKNNDCIFVNPIVYKGRPEININIIQNSKEYPNFKWGIIEEDNEFIKNPENLNKPVEVNVINGCAFAFKIKKFNDKLLFTEDNFMYGEELDLAYRMKIHNWKAILNCRAKVWHNHNWSSSNKLRNNMMQYYITRNRYLFFIRYKRYDWLLINLIKEILLIPFNISWALKKNNWNLIRFYYMGLFHGIMNKKGKYDF